MNGPFTTLLAELWLGPYQTITKEQLTKWVGYNELWDGGKKDGF